MYKSCHFNTRDVSTEEQLLNTSILTTQHPVTCFLLSSETQIKLQNIRQKSSEPEGRSASCLRGFGCVYTVYLLTTITDKTLGMDSVCGNLPSIFWWWSKRPDKLKCNTSAVEALHPTSLQHYIYHPIYSHWNRSTAVPFGVHYWESNDELTTASCLPRWHSQPEYSLIFESECSWPYEPYHILTSQVNGTLCYNCIKCFFTFPNCRLVSLNSKNKDSHAVYKIKYEW